jgi:DMSO/TMAO reductase YedYZ molybdopterin-dependent catalytic subunit
VNGRGPVDPGRRAALQGLAGAVVARWLAGCDRLVLLDELTAEALAPITPTERFYVYQYGPVPDLDPSSHRIEVTFEETPLATFDRGHLASLAGREREHTLQCIGSRPTVQNIGNARWFGLPLVEVLASLGVTPPAEAVELVAVGEDGYDAAIPIGDLTADAPVWLVWEMNGEPLPLPHGAPARLLVPGRYGVKNVKWPAELRFVRSPHTSFWSEQGWSEPAPYRPNTFVASPADGLEVPPGTVVRFVGTAFAGEDVVERVEVSIDGGPWREAERAYAIDQPGVWVLWSFEWEVPEGRHVVQARCTTRDGARSHPTHDGTSPLDGYDGSMSVLVRA